jgi:integrase
LTVPCSKRGDCFVDAGLTSTARRPDLGLGDSLVGARLRRVFNDQRPRQGKLAERILSPDEQTRILAYCGRVPWLRPIILIAVLQALRLGEVLALRPKDVDFKAGKLTVLRSLRKDGSYGPT